MDNASLVNRLHRPNQAAAAHAKHVGIPQNAQRQMTMDTATVNNRPPDTSMLVSAAALGATAQSVTRARRHVTAILRAWQMQGLCQSAELVASELVTNALQAESRATLVLPVMMRLRSDGMRLVIEVWDAAPGEPELRGHAADAEHGRGLEIVSLLSEAWGCYRENGGKVVWASLSP